MKTTASSYLLSLLAAACLLSTSANAALESRLGGLAVYDTDLNVTWLANTATNLRDWSSAKNWAASQSVGGFTDWRLPTTLYPTCGGFNCPDNELGHLFYNELGGVAGSSITTTHNANYSLFHGFPNLNDINIWTSTESVVGLGGVNYGDAVYFTFNVGAQYYIAEWHDMTVMALRNGDVSSVPVPTAAWLLGSGLLGLLGVARKRKA